MNDLQTNPGCLGRLLQLLSGGTPAGNGAEATEAVDERWPYRRRKYLLSQAEFSFFRVLQTVAHENGWVVCPKVNLNDLLLLEKGTEHRMTWLNKINRKHADFVLCDAQTMQPVMVVELDDKTHESAAAKKRDADKDRALAAAELPGKKRCQEPLLLNPVTKTKPCMIFKRVLDVWGGQEKVSGTFIIHRPRNHAQSRQPIRRDDLQIGWIKFSN